MSRTSNVGNVKRIRDLRCIFFRFSPYWKITALSFHARASQAPLPIAQAACPFIHRALFGQINFCDRLPIMRPDKSFDLLIFRGRVMKPYIPRRRIDAVNMIYASGKQLQNFSYEERARAKAELIPIPSWICTLCFIIGVPLTRKSVTFECRHIYLI